MRIRIFFKGHLYVSACVVDVWHGGGREGRSPFEMSILESEFQIPFSLSLAFFLADSRLVRSG